MPDTPLKWLLHKTRPALQVEPVFTLREAAAMVGLQIGQMRRHVKAGRVKSIRIGERGHFKVLQSEIERIREESK